MGYQGRRQDIVKIAVTIGSNVKATRDRCAGILRYMAEYGLKWDMRFFNRVETLAWDDSTRHWKPDGVIANALGGFNSDVFKALRRIRRIVAFLSNDEQWDGSLPRRTVRVSIDNNAIVDAAFGLMLRRGLRHFAYVQAPATVLDSAHSRKRAVRLQSMAQDAGVSFAVCGKAASTGKWTDRLSSIANDLAALPRPCGIIAFNDACARETIDACHLAGLHIPDHVQIVGVDNDESICENVRPRLSSVEPDFDGAGYIMAQRMHELLETGTAAKSTVCGVKRIAERDTTLDLSGVARLITAAEKHIHAHACENLTPASLASALHVSRRLLELRFRSMRNEGVAEAIRKQKLDEVCRQLKETNRPICEIAAICGFPVQTHLNALFRKVFGMTPRDFRRGRG
jgi:LacI family transcriptional regulator